LKKVAVADFEGITSNTTFVLESKDESKMLQGLIPYIMLSDDFTEYSIKKSKGSTNPYILFSDIAEYEFELPNHSKQVELLGLLTACDTAKESYKALIAATDELVKSQFIEMTQGAETIPLSQACVSYSRGRTPKYVEDSHIRVINQACIYWDGIRTENVKFENPSAFREDYLLPVSCVLLNSTGTGTLGRAHVFDVKDQFTYMTDTHVTVLVPREEIIIPVCLQYYFYDEHNQKELYRTCVNGSTTQAELSKEALGRMRIPVVELSRQMEFERFVRQSDKSKFVGVNRSNRNLSRCSDSLVPMKKVGG